MMELTAAGFSEHKHSEWNFKNNQTN